MSFNFAHIPDMNSFGFISFLHLKEKGRRCIQSRWEALCRCRFKGAEDTYLKGKNSGVSANEEFPDVPALSISHLPATRANQLPHQKCPFWEKLKYTHAHPTLFPT